jgi:signal transduction histidine kinase
MTTSASSAASLREAQRLAAAGRLATGLVHDFNNALLIVTACLDQIAADPDDQAAVVEHAGLALDVVARASAIARQLSTFARPQAGGRRLSDLNEIVQAAARLIRPVAGCVNVVVTCQPGALPVRVDTGQIEQALVNLCLNARDAMPAGGTLRLSTSGASTRYAVIEVTDTGAGIPVEAQPFVFDPFFTTKVAGVGCGLGLAMVRDIARGHGGLVEFTSDPAGTTFRLLLPYG